MPEHDFSELYSQYPHVLAQMPKTFNSHQFILELARKNQLAYLEALYSYRDYLHQGEPAPFKNVHRILAQQLSQFPALIIKMPDRVVSTDIFGQTSNSTEWRKVD